MSSFITLCRRNYSKNFKFIFKGLLTYSIFINLNLVSLNDFIVLVTLPIN